MLYLFPSHPARVRNMPENKQIFLVRQFILGGSFRPKFGILACKCINGWSNTTIRNFIIQMKRMLPIRKDELLFILAYIISLKRVNKAVYRSFRIFIRIPTELFKLMHFLVSNNKKSFGRGFKRCVQQLYFKNKTPQKTLEWCLRHKKWKKWKHCDVVRRLHIKFPEEYKFVEAVLMKNGSIKGIQATKTMLRLAKTPYKEDLSSMSDIKMIRMLGSLTSTKELSAFSAKTDIAHIKILDSKRIPVSLLFLALKVYSSGKGILGSKTWTAIPQITYALRWKTQMLLPTIPRNLHVVKGESSVDWHYGLKGSLWTTHGRIIHDLYALTKEKAGTNTEIWYCCDTILMLTTQVTKRDIALFKNYKGVMRRDAKMIIVTTSEQLPQECWSSKDIFVFSAFDDRALSKAAIICK